MSDTPPVGMSAMMAKAPWMFPLMYIVGGGAVGSGVSITFGGASTETPEEASCADPDELEHAIERADLAERGHAQMVISFTTLTGVLSECQSDDGSD